jgi:hypothetical protein
MSFYPILLAPDCTGFTTVCNFPPNDWEIVYKEAKLINLTWTDGNYWHSETIDELKFGSMQTFRHTDVENYLPIGVMPLLSLGRESLPKRSELLPSTLKETFLPAWRATLGLMSPHASTCYQGELDPFPMPGSLLTFAPFIQYGDEVTNYMLFLNLEKSPKSRSSNVEIYSISDPKIIKGTFKVINNNISVVNLDDLGFSHVDLPVIICKGMSGIPLYFSKNRDNSFLSLEHSHPPVSFVVHGNRWNAQKLLKEKWFSSLGTK